MNAMIVLLLITLPILMAVFLLRKHVLHVKLLMALYPNYFDKGISIHSIGFRFPVDKLGFLEYYSWVFPIYISRERHVIKSDLQMDLHKKLVINNRLFLVSFLLFMAIPIIDNYFR